MEEMKRKKLLHLIEKNCRLTSEELSILLDEPQNVIEETLAFFEQERIICGYRGLINWEEVEDDWIEAIVEIRVTAQGTEGYQAVAEQIKRFPQVETVYFLSGPYDFLVMLQGKNIKEISNFISNHLAPIEAVQSTRTHFTLKKYKDWGIELDSRERDERIKVSP